MGAATARRCELCAFGWRGARRRLGGGATSPITPSTRRVRDAGHAPLRAVDVCCRAAGAKPSASGARARTCVVAVTWCVVDRGAMRAVRERNSRALVLRPCPLRDRAAGRARAVHDLKSFESQSSGRLEMPTACGGRRGAGVASGGQAAALSQLNFRSLCFWFIRVEKQRAQRPKVPDPSALDAGRCGSQLHRAVEELGAKNEAILNDAVIGSILRRLSEADVKSSEASNLIRSSRRAFGVPGTFKICTVGCPCRRPLLLL